jgi:hypothetical protein
MRRLVVAVMAIFVFGALASVGQAGRADDRGGDRKDKVAICHVPRDNPDSARTIRVAQAAVKAHLAHGDSAGRCEQDDDDEN